MLFRLLDILHPLFGSVSICECSLGDAERDDMLVKYANDGVVKRDLKGNLSANLTLRSRSFVGGFVRLSFDSAKKIERVFLVMSTEEKDEWLQTEGIFPNRRSIRERKKRGMEEERRLMYVAVTRAEKALFLTESEGYTIHGGFDKYPSRFLREIQQNLFVTEGVISDEIWAQADAFKNRLDLETLPKKEISNEWEPGTEVVHAHFGEGIVKEIYDDGMFCEVEFGESGLRCIRVDKLTPKNQVEEPVTDELDDVPEYMKKLELVIAVKAKQSLPN